MADWGMYDPQTGKVKGPRPPLKKVPSGNAPTIPIPTSPPDTNPVFNGGPQIGGPTSSGGTPVAQVDPSALADITSILDQYGLGSLAQWAWGELTAGKTESQVVLDLYNTPEFNAAFPEIGLRQQAGLPPISPADILSYRDQAMQLFRAAGLPAGFYDSPSDFTQFIAQDVSLSELQQRVNLASQAVYQAPKAVLDAFQRDFGVGPGGLTAYFLDPSRAEPLLQQQFAAAQIGGAGTLAGYGTDASLDTRLAGEGVTFQGALSGFSDLGAKRQLFNPLPGENGRAITADQQIGAEFEQNATDQALINTEAARRRAQFQGGGGFAQSSQGFTGLGSAQGA